MEVLLLSPAHCTPACPLSLDPMLPPGLSFPTWLPRTEHLMPAVYVLVTLQTLLGETLAWLQPLCFPWKRGCAGTTLPSRRRGRFRCYLGHPQALLGGHRLGSMGDTPTLPAWRDSHGVPSSASPFSSCPLMLAPTQH